MMPVRFIRNLLGRRARVRALEEEMRAHLDMLVEENLRRGLSEKAARRQANLAFGNFLSTRERSADAMSWAWLESWWQDLRFATRSLARRPWFSLSLVAILAAGLGLTVSMFSLVRGMLFLPLPVPAPDELHLALDRDSDPARLSAPTVRRLAAQAGWSGRVAAYSDPTDAAWRPPSSAAESISVQFVNGSFFDALGIRTAQGRLLSSADDQLGNPRMVAIASWDWWQRAHGGDEAAIGRSLRLNGIDVTLAGVAPKSFSGVSLGAVVDLWMPAGAHALLRCSPSAWSVSRDEPPTLDEWMRDDRVAWLNVLVRVPSEEPGAQAALESAWGPQLATLLDIVDDAIGRERIARDVPQFVASPGGFSGVRDRFREVALTISFLVGAVLLVTVANTSTLLLLRMLSRTREIGVRLALGVGRARLVRSSLMESLLLSSAGAVAGCLLGLWLTPHLARWVVPGAVDVPPAIDRTLLLALGAGVVVLGLLLGAAPSWFSARLSPQQVLQRRGLLGGSLKFGRGLIVAQLALSVMLIAVAGSLALDVRRVLSGDFGYDRSSVITGFFDLRAAGFSDEQVPAETARLREVAQSLPQVRAVGFAASGVLSGSRSASRTFFRGDDLNHELEHVQTESLDENYFDAMGMRLLRGRDIMATDRTESPRVAIVSQELARIVYGESDPVGRRFGWSEHANGDDWEIVGVVSDARVNSVRGKPPPLYYTPLAQRNEDPHCMVVRVEGDATVAREALRRAVAEAAPGVVFSHWLTLEERAMHLMRKDFATVRLTAGFGAVALLLAAIGVFGAFGYLVASRSREIAVRMAVGADPSQVQLEIVREAAWIGLLGGCAGLGLALVLPRVLSSWMSTGLQTDWLAIAVATLIGITAAVVGGLRPARRAARVDPLLLLRAD